MHSEIFINEINDLDCIQIICGGVKCGDIDETRLTINRQLLKTNGEDMVVHYSILFTFLI